MKATLLQLNSGNDLVANVAAVRDMAARAVERDAPNVVSMPENAFMMPGSPQELFDAAMPEASHPAVLAMRELAADKGVWIHIGGVAVPSPTAPGKCANRTLLISAEGEVVARYDKIHLYDASPAGGESHRESARFSPGRSAVAVDAPFGRVGLTICYDLRFPGLFRRLAREGCAVIFAPAAFTAYTGRLHWEILLRARAVETGCFIVAAAQTGAHPAGRHTFGHSMVVSPWGEIIETKEKDAGFLTVDMDLSETERYRAQIPSLALEAEYDFALTDAR
ncbi:MAG: carbon-nitrogen hydrolase family protein [Rickettsiales bacterium]